LLLPMQSAQAACSSGGNLGAGVVLSPTTVHLGDTVNIIDDSVNIAATACTASNGMLWIVYPDNHNELAMQNFTLLSGTEDHCISVNNPLAGCQTITTAITVVAPVAGTVISIHTNIAQAGPGFGFTCSATVPDTNHIIFLAAAQAQNGSTANFPLGCGQ